MITSIILILISVVLLTLSVCACAWFIYTINHREKNHLVELRFEELMAILSLIINTEFDEYDKELLVGNRPITNQNFDTFYKDITDKILANISPELSAALSLYTTQDNIVRIIARRTKQYLREKIDGTV